MKKKKQAKIAAVAVSAALIGAPVAAKALPKPTPVAITLSEAAAAPAQAKKTGWLSGLLAKIGAGFAAIAGGWYLFAHKTKIGRFVKAHGGWKLAGLALLVILAAALIILLAVPGIVTRIAGWLRAALELLGAVAIIIAVWKIRGGWDKHHHPSPAADH